MPLDNTDILAYARMRVDDKSVLDRLRHSSKLHPARSAFSSKQSFVSKSAGVASIVARTAMKLVPVPIVGNLLWFAETAVEKKVRERVRERSLEKAEAAGNDYDAMKFELKLLSIESLDRYRWKLHEAMTQLEAAKVKYNTALARSDSMDAGDVCDTLLEIALAYAQAERRHEVLQDQCRALVGSLNAALEWCNQCSAGIHETKASLKEHFKREVDLDNELTNRRSVDGVADRHRACGDYCYARSQHAGPDRWSGVRKAAALAVKTVSDPFGPEVFVTFNPKTYRYSPTYPSQA